jgi:hypothetical protein
MKEKTVGQLIDELITTSMKLWVCQDTLVASEDEHEVYKTTKLALELNERRSSLIKAIDESFGFGHRSVTEKVYR